MALFLFYFTKVGYIYVMEKKKESTPDFSTRESTIAYLKSIGAKHVQKKGAILMPLSKEMREAMERDKNKGNENIGKE